MYVDSLYSTAPDQGAVLLAALFPRSYIDPNRTLSDLDPDLVRGAWPGALTPGTKTALGVGLIWRNEPTGGPMYNRKLSVAEVEARIDGYYRPYHDTLRAALDEAHRRHGARVAPQLPFHAVDQRPFVAGGPQCGAAAVQPGRPRRHHLRPRLHTALSSAPSRRWAINARSTIPTRGSSWCAPIPTRPQTATACRSKSAGRFTCEIEISRRLKTWTGYPSDRGDLFRKDRHGFAKLKADLDRLYVDRGDHCRRRPFAKPDCTAHALFGRTRSDMGVNDNPRVRRPIYSSRCSVRLVLRGDHRRRSSISPMPLWSTFPRSQSWPDRAAGSTEPAQRVCPSGATDASSPAGPRPSARAPLASRPLHVPNIPQRDGAVVGTGASAMSSFWFLRRSESDEE